MNYTSTFFKAIVLLFLTGTSLYSYSQDLTITTEVCNNTGGSEVRMTGPWWAWDPAGGPIAVDNMDGTYTFTLSPAPTADMEYLLVFDGIQENLISEMAAGGTCAPITDFVNYANRQWLTTDPAAITNVFGQCGACGSSANLDITIDVCGATPDSVKITGPMWGWDPTGGVLGTDNGNGTWTVSIPEPATDMEYLVIVDGVQENLIQDMIDGGSCAPVTDFFNYANRIWLTTDPVAIDVVFDRCVPCSYPDVAITVEICDDVVAPFAVKLVGPPNWDFGNGKTGIDNGNGTWTFNYSPAPSDSIEYQVFVDGTGEDLVQDMLFGGTCAISTDYSTYANRLWVLADAPVFDITYNTCATCATAGIDELELELEVYPNPTSEFITISNVPEGYNYTIYNTVGSVLNSGTDTQSIDVSALNSGLYFIELNGNGQKARVSFVKQ
jgi:hypothetical protein